MKVENGKWECLDAYFGFFPQSKANFEGPKKLYIGVFPVFWTPGQRVGTKVKMQLSRVHRLQNAKTPAGHQESAGVFGYWRELTP